MRKIQVEKWKVKTSAGDEVEDSILTILNVLLSSRRPEEMPRGLDNFRLMQRLSKVFEKAEQTGILELEEADYSFLKSTVESGIPSIWAMNKNIASSVDAFLNAKEE